MEIRCIMDLSSLALLRGPSYSFISQIQLITIPPGMCFGTADFVQNIMSGFKATKMEIEGLVPVLEKCTIQ